MTPRETQYDTHSNAPQLGGALLTTNPSHAHHKKYSPCDGLALDRLNLQIAPPARSDAAVGNTPSVPVPAAATFQHLVEAYIAVLNRKARSA